MATKKESIKLEELVKINTGLNSIAGKELPVELSWKIARFQKKIEPALSLLDEKVKGLVKKYGTENENGTFTIPKEKIEDYNKEKADYYDQEEKVEVPDLSFSRDFKSIKELTPAFFNMVSSIIKD